MTAARATVFIGMLAAPAMAARLTQSTAEAFDRYVHAVDARMQSSRTTAQFIALPSPNDRARVRNGELLAFSERDAQAAKMQGGEIHDWTGVVFIPRANIAAARAVMQDYADYKVIYKPDILDSKLLAHEDDRFHVFLRLYAKSFVTVVFNSEYDITFGEPTPRRMYIDSRSTRIAQVSDPDKSMTEEKPVGNDDGYLWRMMTYWRFEEADGGVWAECRAISLSRTLPLGLGWLRGFIERFPRESMTKGLESTKRAVAARSGGAGVATLGFSCLPKPCPTKSAPPTCTAAWRRENPSASSTCASRSSMPSRASKARS